jgi:multiple sugar transport system permease protein
VTTVRKGSEGSAGRDIGLASRTAIYSMLGFVATLFVAPLIWMFSTSIKPADQALSTPPRLLPSPASDTLKIASENYQAVWNDPVVDFPLYFRNTLLVAVLSVIGMVLSSAIVAYGFARVKWRGKKWVFPVMLATMMIPFPVVMVPLYVIFKQFGWIGTFSPLWIPAWFGGAFNIFMLRQFYMTIPRELDEAARIDGCSHWGIFWRIILPLSRPALTVVALFHFIGVWNDFLGPLIFLNDRDQFTLALGLQLYQSQTGNTPWHLLMAASTMVVAPVLVLFLLAQRTFIEGIATSGLKE